MMRMKMNKYEYCETCKFCFSYSYICRLCVKSTTKNQIPYFYLNRSTKLHNYCLLCSGNDPAKHDQMRCSVCHNRFYERYPTEFANALNSRHNDEYFMYRILYFLDDLHSVENSELLKLMGTGSYFLNECIKVLESEEAIIVNGTTISKGEKFKIVFNKMQIRKKLVKKLKLEPITEVK